MIALLLATALAFGQAYPDDCLRGAGSEYPENEECVSLGGWQVAVDLDFSSLTPLDVKAAGDGAITHDGYDWYVRNSASCSAAAFGGGSDYGWTASGGAGTYGCSLLLRVDPFVEGWNRQFTKFRVMVRLRAGATMSTTGDIYDIRWQDSTTDIPTPTVMMRPYCLTATTYRVDATGWASGAYYSYSTSPALPDATLPRWVVADVDDGHILTGYASTVSPPESADISRGTANSSVGAEPLSQDARWLVLTSYKAGAAAQTFHVERVVVEYLP